MLACPGRLATNTWVPGSSTTRSSPDTDGCPESCGAEFVISVIERAVNLASSSAASSPELVESLGGGWVAEEALAISLFCALRADSFEHGVRLAVNHGGDSDSTGSLTGQLLGTLWGADVIPPRWLDELELRDVIETMATDLVAATGDTTRLESRYPGW